MLKKIIILSLISITAIADNCVETKYIFDVGSGGIFTQGFEYQKCENKIIRKLNENYTSFSLQKCVSNSSDQKSIFKKCFKQADIAIKTILSDLSLDCKKFTCSGIATAWARNANNAQELLAKFKKHGINIEIISQKQEGVLSFKSVLENYHKEKIDPKKTIVFDIGGGSFQITDQSDDNRLNVFKGKYGMYNLQATIKKKFGSYKNGFSKDYNLENVKKFVFDLINDELKNDNRLIDKLKLKDVKILGIGKFFGKGLKTQLELGEYVDLSKIEGALEKIFNKSALEIHQIYPNMPLQYCSSAQYSLLLIYAVLKHSELAQIETIEDVGVNKVLATYSLQSLK